MNLNKENYIQLYGELFRLVQTRRIFADSKTFVDSLPLRDPEIIIADFNAQKSNRNFDLKIFVENNFRIPKATEVEIDLPGNRSMEEHIELLWKFLFRNPEEHTEKYNSLINLPETYIVPGGRFREIYYWDSYFTMQGLIAGGHLKAVENMINNFTYLIENIGFVPNGNRVYYTTRSQPPFYTPMVKLLIDNSGYENLYQKYLIPVEKEYNFWMGNDRSVFLDEVEINLNRYFDSETKPREESYYEDFQVAENNPGVNKENLFRNIRAACESGWDFSSRWFNDGINLSTCRTTDILPIDLNTLICFIEKYLSVMYEKKGDYVNHKKYLELASERVGAINQLFWDNDKKFYFDYNFVKKELREIFSLAGCYPLYFKVAEEKHAAGVAENIEKKFLKDGGLITTTNYTGQQWDAPNGWAPMQWIAVKGLRNYGYNKLADKIKGNWLTLNESVFNRTGKMFEKYNAADTSLFAGGGEYDLQDGFGWTNGVALALIKNLDKKIDY
ncbi:MAG: hypothetical protein K9J16_05730 [Melioribacteraceae bacterium]|nr:hypothetical protein [Melioribacteraceae bacterium]MCF8353300.1 hypothetical protein [Melioribacteraceae bacterium]MCF8395415.1 hypothetical protein [Melioribacteraceae bacterium]MCF8418827.1 hypothetical protein [Melioribacteraceae bacterium]